MEQLLTLQDCSEQASHLPDVQSVHNLVEADSQLALQRLGPQTAKVTGTSSCSCCLSPHLNESQLRALGLARHAEDSCTCISEVDKA